MKPKVSVKAKGPRRRTSELHQAARNNDAAKLSALLNRKDLHIDSLAAEGWTPLHHAVASYSVEAVAVLIAAGANVEAEDDFGRTPLFPAVYESRGRGEIIKLLREAGADPNHPLPGNGSALKTARGIANYDVAQFFADLPM